MHPSAVVSGAICQGMEVARLGAGAKVQAQLSQREGYPRNIADQRQFLWSRLRWGKEAYVSQRDVEGVTGNFDCSAATLWLAADRIVSL